MKRILIVLIIILLPLSAFAMKPISDEGLSIVSGSSGVSFFVNVTMDISIDVIAWGDSDGLENNAYNPWGLDTVGGYVGVTNLRAKNLSVKSGARSGKVSHSIRGCTYWPDGVTIDVHDGVVYYHRHMQPNR